MYRPGELQGAVLDRLAAIRDARRGGSFRGAANGASGRELDATKYRTALHQLRNRAEKATDALKKATTLYRLMRRLKDETKQESPASVGIVCMLRQIEAELLIVAREQRPDLEWNNAIAGAVFDAGRSVVDAVSSLLSDTFKVAPWLLLAGTATTLVAGVGAGAAAASAAAAATLTGSSSAATAAALGTASALGTSGVGAAAASAASAAVTAGASASAAAGAVASSATIGVGSAITGLLTLPVGVALGTAALAVNYGFGMTFDYRETFIVTMFMAYMSIVYRFRELYDELRVDPGKVWYEVDSDEEEYKKGRRKLGGDYKSLLKFGIDQGRFSFTDEEVSEYVKDSSMALDLDNTMVVLGEGRDERCFVPMTNYYEYLDRRYGQGNGREHSWLLRRCFWHENERNAYASVFRAMSTAHQKVQVDGDAPTTSTVTTVTLTRSLASGNVLGEGEQYKWWDFDSGGIARKPTSSLELPNVVVIDGGRRIRVYHFDMTSGLLVNSTVDSTQIEKPTKGTPVAKARPIAVGTAVNADAA